MLQAFISGKPSSLEVQWGQRTALMEISLWQITLSDFEGKELYINPRLFNYYEHAYHFELDFAELEEAYYKNKLSGKLKELVASLLENEESNNVFVFADFN